MFELNAPVGESGSRKLAPEGSHVARCYQIIDLGTTMQDGMYPGKKRKVQFLFELPLELAVFDEAKGAQPFYVRAMYTLSLHENASLRRDLESWIGKKLTDKEASEFNIFKLIGVPCLVNVVHVTRGENTYANIVSISPVVKGMKCPPQINPSVLFSSQAPDMEVMKSLPEFIIEKIKRSDEYLAFMDAQMSSPEVSFESDRNDFLAKKDDPGNWEDSTVKMPWEA